MKQESLSESMPRRGKGREEVASEMAAEQKRSLLPIKQGNAIH